MIFVNRWLLHILLSHFTLLSSSTFATIFRKWWILQILLWCSMVRSASSTTSIFYWTLLLNGVLWCLKQSFNSACWVTFHAFVEKPTFSKWTFSKWTFSKWTFSKNFVRNTNLLSECQTVWIQIRTDVMSVLIWVQIVCNAFQLMSVLIWVQTVCTGFQLMMVLIWVQTVCNSSKDKSHY